MVSIRVFTVFINISVLKNVIFIEQMVLNEMSNHCTINGLYFLFFQVGFKVRWLERIFRIEENGHTAMKIQNHMGKSVSELFPVSLCTYAHIMHTNSHLKISLPTKC